MLAPDDITRQDWQNQLRFPFSSYGKRRIETAGVPLQVAAKIAMRGFFLRDNCPLGSVKPPVRFATLIADLKTVLFESRFELCQCLILRIAPVRLRHSPHTYSN